jgi:S1-C subfamily serine protease
MNFLDLFLVLVLAYVAFQGYRRGALAQVFTFGGAALGLAAGAAFAPGLAGRFVDQPGPLLALVTLALLLGLLVAGQAIGFAIGARLRAVAAGAGAAAVDRTAGLAVGLAALVVGVWLLAAALAQGPSPVIARQVQQSDIVAAITNPLPPPPDLFGRVGNYLDRSGFPQVFSGFGGGVISPPVDPAADEAVAAAQRAGGASMVPVQARGCGGVSTGSGFVTDPGFVVTNAHVVAGSEAITIRDDAGTHSATPILFNPDQDLAVLSSPETAAPPIEWVSAPAERGTDGATLGYPGGQRELSATPATIRSRGRARGRDIYGRGSVTRDILTLSADVRRGGSGGPMVTRNGRVAGVVFAAGTGQPDVGYALTAGSVLPQVESAIEQSSVTVTGRCRF